MKPVDLTPEAEADLLAIVDWLAGWSAAAALGFVDQFEQALDRMRTFPAIGVQSRAASRRRRVLHVGIYDFVYEEFDEQLILQRILDGRRLRSRP